MHIKEYGNGFNTAVTVMEAFPKNSQLCIADGTGDIEGPGRSTRVVETLIATHNHVLVLTPSPSAITLSEYKEKMNLDLSKEKLVFIVLDGTWTQTKRLAKREIFGKLQHIKLETAGDTLSTLRKQTSFGRITTGEAVMLILAEMGDYPEEVEYLHERLQYRIQKAMIQKGRT